MKVVFIGVGNMGGPMAVNLHHSGQEVIAVDLSEVLREQMRAEGLATAESPLDVCEGAGAVVTMLPHDQAVESVYIQGGLLDHLEKGTLIIDCSTISPSQAKRLHEHGEQAGLAVLDAPVSGGVAGAKAGTLSFICGGTNEAFERAGPILKGMGSNVFRAGDAGAGQIVKIVNNMLLAIQMVGTAEALSFGVDNGIDPKVLSDIMKVSSGQNWCLDKYNPWPDVMTGVPSSNDYQGGFLVKLMQKDLSLAAQLSRASGSSTPMGGLAMSLYDAYARQSDTNANLDFSAIQRLFRGEL
jgi:3-hydroxyisobutyrate dehydrogenase